MLQHRIINNTRITHHIESIQSNLLHYNIRQYGIAQRHILYDSMTYFTMADKVHIGCPCLALQHNIANIASHETTPYHNMA